MKNGLVCICLDMIPGSTEFYVLQVMSGLKKEANFSIVGKPDEADIIIVNDRSKSVTALNGKIYLFCDEGLRLQQLHPKGSPSLKIDETLADLINRLGSGVN